MKKIAVVTSLVFLALLIIAFIGCQFYLGNLRQSGQVQLSLPEYHSNSTPFEIMCSENKSSAIGTLEEGLLASCGDTEALPTASMAKTLTALVVLEKSPDVEKVITLDADDFRIWEETVRVNGSNIHIYIGEQLSLKQLITGMMLASANNLADSIVRHEFGSFSQYKLTATQFLRRHNLTDTQIGADASGFDEGTVASAMNMFEIGRLALSNDILREIVGTETIEFPQVGGGIEVEQTTNGLLKTGYIGIKTGYTDNAGDCVLFAKQLTQEYTAIGVVMGSQQRNLTYSIVNTYMDRLTDSIVEHFVIEAGDVVGKLQFNNGRTFEYRSQSSLQTRELPGTNGSLTAEVSDDNSVVTIQLLGKSVEAVLPQCSAPPSSWWDLVGKITYSLNYPYC